MGFVGGFVKILGGFLSIGVILSAIFVGWLIQSPQGPAEGIFFATMFPLMSMKLPATIVGHGSMTGVDPVPDDLMPQPRPEKELFIDLPNEQRMPQNGIGMCCRPTVYDSELAMRTTLWYLLLGGRLIDTAQIYMNHKGIGKGIKEAVRRGIPREEIFVTTKLWPRFYGYESAKRLVPSFLEELGAESVDLLLMHAPSNYMFPGWSKECEEKGLTRKQCRLDTWRALSELREQGLVKNLGVSNFAKNHLEQIEELGLAPIAVNQITYNPWAPDFQVETFEYCQSKGIAITAYSSLGGFMQKSEANSTRVLTELSQKYNATVAQVMLRWAIQKGAAVIPGTGNPKHMRENLAVYDFEIAEEDMQRIAALGDDEEAKKFFYFKPPSE